MRGWSTFVGTASTASLTSGMISVASRQSLSSTSKLSVGTTAGKSTGSKSKGKGGGSRRHSHSYSLLGAVME